MKGVRRPLLCYWPAQMKYAASVGHIRAGAGVVGGQAGKRPFP